MYAIVQVGAQQIKVAEGEMIKVSRLVGKVDGDMVTLDKVLMVVNGEDVAIGQPYVKNAKVEVKVVKQLLGEKRIAFKFRKRKESQTKRGYRQKLTALNIVKISV